MAFAKSKPTRIYAYGALPPESPGELKLVEDQMHLAHKYRNVLCDLEIKRRNKVEAKILEIFPELAGLAAEVAEVERRIDEHYAEVRGRNQKVRGRTATDDDRVKVEDLKAARKAIWKKTSEARKPIWTDPRLVPFLAEYEAEFKAAHHAARASCGLYWGTYLAVEGVQRQFREGGPPQFKPWNGDGRVAAQIQKGKTVEQLSFMSSTVIYIPMLPKDSWDRGKGDLARRVTVKVRIGSTDKGRPVWASFRILMHKPIPDGAVIKWATVIRRRIGTQCRWQVQLTISSDTGFDKPDRASRGCAGLDVGWRMMTDGSLRVAVWAGDDGQEGELRIPPRMVGAWPHVDQLQGRRDDNFNAARGQLVEWLQGRELVPSWLEEQTENLAWWRSANRLVKVVNYWEMHRFEGDEQVFGVMAAWRRQDRHLHDWCAFRRRKNEGWRKDLYRCFAANMSRRYKTIAMEQLNLAIMMVRPDSIAQVTNNPSRYYARMAACGILMDTCMNRFKETSKQEAAFTTQRCHKCRQIELFNAGPTVMHTCSHCGETWDQDYNAAYILRDLALGHIEPVDPSLLPKRPKSRRKKRKESGDDPGNPPEGA